MTYPFAIVGFSSQFAAEIEGKVSDLRWNFLFIENFNTGFSSG